MESKRVILDNITHKLRNIAVPVNYELKYLRMLVLDAICYYRAYKRWPSWSHVNIQCYAGMDKTVRNDWRHYYGVIISILAQSKAVSLALEEGLDVTLYTTLFLKREQHILVITL